MRVERESSEAIEMENLKRSEEEEEDREDDEEEDESELGNGSESRSLEPEVCGVLKACQSQTLDVRSSSGFPEENRFDGVMINSKSKSNDGVQSEENVKVLSEEVPVVTAIRNAGAQMETQHQSSPCRNLSELSPTSVTQPISSATSPTTIDQKSSQTPQCNYLSRPKADQQNSLARKATSLIPTLKTPSSDGYNWRKYGQKQVKSPTGSRSYYRCTHAECYAKKIECSDHSGCVKETVYRSLHTHDPPKKNSSSREKLSTAERASGNNAAKQPCSVHKDSDITTPAKQNAYETPLCSNMKRPNLSNSDEKGYALVKYENENEPEPKRRLKKGYLEDSGSLLKPSKKPKFVVHATGDVGISADGYRWRKYGQKMVKGNRHPRNYYRCTSAGCPVRKHIETAVEDPKSVIITYKGVHDHDMPVPKKRHGPPSAPLVAAAAPASMKPETVKNQTKWSVDKEGELTGEAMDLGGDKAIESARTLLSIGFEIKPC